MKLVEFHASCVYPTLSDLAQGILFASKVPLRNSPFIESLQ